MSYILAGKATHFKTHKEWNIAACGTPGPEYSTEDTRKVDCFKCRKTKKYLEALKQNLESGK